MNKVINVLVVDDHPLVRDGISTGLSTEQDIKVVGQAEDGIQAEEVALNLKPDVIIMDIYMPRRGGIESMRAIKEKLPGTKVLLLTISEQDDDVVQSVRFGTDGYLLKNTTIGEVANAVRRVAVNEIVYSSFVTTILADEVKRKDKPDTVDLTLRESEVLQFVAEGQTSREIAKSLTVSQHTVSVHIHHILSKLKLKNRAQVAAYVAHNRLRKL